MSVPKYLPMGEKCGHAHHMNTLGGVSADNGRKFKTTTS
jgi:hypothetical protein